MILSANPVLFEHLRFIYIFRSSFAYILSLVRCYHEADRFQQHNRSWFSLETIVSKLQYASSPTPTVGRHIDLVRGNFGRIFCSRGSTTYLAMPTTEKILHGLRDCV